MPGPVTDSASTAAQPKREPGSPGSRRYYGGSTKVKESKTRRRSRATGPGSDASRRSPRSFSGGANKPAEPPQLDTETANALTLFNTYLDAHQERQKRARQLKRAEVTKSKAASKVKRLTERKAPSAELAAAEAAYRKAVETLRTLKQSQ